ncbi:unnamed protein product [Adineta steineri]|uniref:Bcl-2 Bcl-2 homology region 1-3 domain-containing protein n=1 Tax=Adineta steineri TaxID=433720 RepID=A0A813R4Q8_9BILA|nr:unnamed protein product [Adineta steineri]CAF0805851.1 unnamed protein product [Adineta steineri]CAF3532658.1 unnamed protein product [Adineta steineri]CAF3808970.1 unnamed protein product [Adineta steineri]
MGANDSPTTTRSIVTDYFDWRLNNNRTITDNRLFLLVRQIGPECEARYHLQQPAFNMQFATPTVDLQTLNNIRHFHREIANEIFNGGGVTWARIITLISWSAILAERTLQHLQQQQQGTNSLPPNTIISSIIDWTTDYIDTDLGTWLESQNYWDGCLKKFDNRVQRRNSIGRGMAILGTIG